MEKQNKPIKLSALSSEMIREMRKRGYQESSIRNIMGQLKHLEKFISDNNLPGYTPGTGSDFITWFFADGKHSQSSMIGYVSLVHHLDDCFLGNGFHEKHLSKKEKMPSCYEFLTMQFLRHCAEDNGNAENSIACKESACRKFWIALHESGCDGPDSVTAEAVCKAASVLAEHCWGFVREMLAFLATAGLFPCDFSTLVPRKRKKSLLPTVYSKNELRAALDAVDTSTARGKRDLAIMLLAMRLGIRAGDISRLSMDALDFEKNEIRFTQEKTGYPITLSMLPEIHAALKDYISNGRPAVASAAVFWNTKVPVGPIKRWNIQKITTKYLRLAGVEIGTRKHGPHSFRSSLASAMVNTGVPYDMARKVLGHTDPDSIRHYAALDVESLRKCALEVPFPAGNFKEMLEGRRNDG